MSPVPDVPPALCQPAPVAKPAAKPAAKPSAKADEVRQAAVAKFGETLFYRAGDDLFAFPARYALAPPELGLIGCVIRSRETAFAFRLSDLAAAMAARAATPGVAPPRVEGAAAGDDPTIRVTAFYLGPHPDFAGMTKTIASVRREDKRQGLLNDLERFPAPGGDYLVRISEDRGVLMRYSICKSGGLTFFLSNDGFYMIDRGGTMTPIGSKRVDRTVLADADLTNPRYMQAIADPVSKRVHWFYKSAASANINVLDKELIYDWSLDKWSQADASVTGASSVIPLSTTLESLDAIGNLDALPYSLDSYTSTYASSLAIMTSDGRLGFRTGANVEATLDTPEGMIGNGVRTYVKGAQPIGDAAGALVSCRSRDRLFDTYIEGVETPIGVRGYATFRANGRFNTIRTRIPAGQLWSYIRSVDVDSQKAGLR